MSNTDKIMALLQYAKDNLIYVDGELYWREDAKIKNVRGKKAGCLEKKGYLVIHSKSIHPGGQSYKVHRIIFLMHHGYLPVMVDHINGDKLDNRIENLRAATPAQNTNNAGPRANNKSGFKGVCRAMSGKWQASIRTKEKRLYLGVFPTPEEAHAAYTAAAKLHHKEFARTV